MNKDTANDGSEIMAIGAPNSEARKQSKRRWKVSYLTFDRNDEQYREYNLFTSELEADEFIKEHEDDYDDFQKEEL